MYTKIDKLLETKAAATPFPGSRRMLALGCLMLGALGLARADMLVAYDFRGQDGTQALTEPAQVASYLEASAISRGAGYAAGTKVGMTQDTMAFLPEAKGDRTVFMQPYVVGDALKHEAYFEITLKPEEGHILSVQSITLGTRRASRRSGPNHCEVRSSLDGFATPLATVASTAGAGGNESVDLVVEFGRALENLHTAVTLRFYGYGRAEPTNQLGIWAISNPAAGPAVIEGRLRKKTP